MFRRISTFWIILIVLLITSAVPLGLMALSAIRPTHTEVEREQIVQLTARVDAHASAIDERLRGFEITTRLAAAQARVLLLNPEDQLAPKELQTVLQKYQRDPNNVYGLDNWYDHSYFPQFGDDHQSNVFLNQNTLLTSKLKSAIAVTEQLNPVFEAIHSSDIGTQWIYLTLAEGMMRLYPWLSNDEYPVDWEPQTISFYTVANRERNPEKESVWTAPYNDYAGAGLMVTNSDPIYDGDTLIGVMSHDFCIADLQREVLGFQVGKEGFAFLLDSDGNIIAHKDYAPEDTALGEELSIKLSEQEPTMAPVVAAMLSESKGEGARNVTVTRELGKKWVVVFSRIPTTDWHLGLMQPRREIIQPALNITRQLLIGAIGLVGLAFVVSIGLASWISRPLIQLSGAARKIESSVDAMDASLATDQDLAVGTVDLSQIGGAREVSSLISVFSQMVSALQKRIKELGSIYVMGQTIISKIDYEQTLKTILLAVQRVVRYDAAEVSIVHGNELIVEAWSGQEGFEDTTGHRCPLDQRLKGQIVQSKTSLLIPTVSLVELQKHLPTADAATLTKIIDSGVKSFVGVPLSIAERLIGILTLVHHEASNFTEDDRRQLSRLAAQAAIAIENAVQVRQRESVLREQIQELQIKIDAEQKAQQVEEIVESEDFQRLRDQARRLRERD